MIVLRWLRWIRSRYSPPAQYGALEFSHEGKTKVYPAVEKMGDFATFGNYLYMGEGNKVVKYNLDVKTK